MQKLALDVGKARIGVAVSQASLALPHSVVANDDQALSEVAQLVSEFRPAAIYIGLPISLSGSYTPSTNMAIEFAKALSNIVDAEIRFIDERLTSKSASMQLRKAGKSSREQKSVIDASAAAIILEFALQSERDGLAGKGLDQIDA